MNQSIDEGLTAQEQAQDERDHQRMFAEQNAWGNDDEIAEIIAANVHPIDVRTDPVLQDPAMVDLQPFRDAARADRIRRQEAATARKQERMREIYGEQMYAAPTQDTHDPDKIKSLSSAEQALKELCGA